MADALKYAAAWMSVCAVVAVAVVACGEYNQDLAKFKHEEWLIKQQACDKRGGLMEKSWGVDTCEDRK